MRLKLKEIRNKYTNLNIQAKAGMWFAICGFLQKGISFVTIPIFTRLLTVNEYGLTTLYNTWSSILIIFATLNLSGGVYNRGLLEFDEKKYTSSVQALATTCSLLLFSVVLIFNKWFVSFCGLNLNILIIMCIYFIFVAGLNLWTVRERFFYRYKLLVATTMLNTFFSTVLGLTAVFLSESDKGTQKIIWTTIGLIIVAIPFYIWNFIKGKTFLDKKMWKYSLSFNIPLIPHYLSNLILNQSDRVMINIFFGPAEVAYYSVAYSVSSIVRVFVDSINQTLTSWRYQNLEKKEYKNINRVSIIILAGVGCLIVLINLFAPEVIKIFGGKNYQEAVWVIPPVMLSVYFIFLYGMFSNIEFYFLKTKFMMVASMFSAVLNLILNYLFLNVYGYIACAYTSLFCYIIYCLFHYIYMAMICNKEIGNKRIFNVRHILLITFTTVILTFMSTILYFNTFVRYAVLLFIALVFFIKRNTLKEFIKMEFQR